MLPPPRTALATALGIGITRTVAIGQAGVGGTEPARVTREFLVRGAAGAGDLAARMHFVRAVVEVERAAGGRRCIVRGAAIALVHARGRNEVGLSVAGDAHFGGPVAPVVLVRGIGAGERHAAFVAGHGAVDGLAVGARVAGAAHGCFASGHPARAFHVRRGAVVVLVRYSVAGLFLVGHRGLLCGCLDLTRCVPRVFA